jgi:hypothetical protein
MISLVASLTIDIIFEVWMMGDSIKIESRIETKLLDRHGRRLYSWARLLTPKNES